MENGNYGVQIVESVINNKMKQFVLNGNCGGVDR